MAASAGPPRRGPAAAAMRDWRDRAARWTAAAAAWRAGAACAGGVTIGGRATELSGASGRIVTVRTFLGSVSTLGGVPPLARGRGSLLTGQRHLGHGGAGSRRIPDINRLFFAWHNLLVLTAIAEPVVADLVGIRIDCRGRRRNLGRLGAGADHRRSRLHAWTAKPGAIAERTRGADHREHEYGGDRDQPFAAAALRGVVVILIERRRRRRTAGCQVERRRRSAGRLMMGRRGKRRVGGRRIVRGRVGRPRLRGMRGRKRELGGRGAVGRCLVPVAIGGVRFRPAGRCRRKRIERRLLVPIHDWCRVRWKRRGLNKMRRRIGRIRSVVTRIVSRLTIVMIGVVILLVLRCRVVIRLRCARRLCVLLLASKVGKRVVLADQTRQFGQRIAAVPALIRRAREGVVRSVTCVVVRHDAFRVRYDRWGEPRLRRFHVIGGEAIAFPRAPRRPTGPIQRQLPSQHPAQGPVAPMSFLDHLG